MGKTSVLPLALMLALLLPILPAWAQPSGRFRYYVNVERPGNYEMAVDIVNHGFPFNGTLDPYSAQVISPGGRILPVSISFEREVPLGSELEHRNAISFTTSDGELCFFATGPDPYIKVAVDREDLDRSLGFTFSARGRFEVALRDASLLRVISWRNVSAEPGPDRIFLGYLASSLSRDRPYAFFVIPGPEPGCLSGLRLVSGRLLVRWAADSPGRYVVTLDTAPSGSQWTTIPSARRVEPTRREGFVVLPDFPSNLSGTVELRVRVTGNLSPVTAVQARLDYDGQYGWNDDKGVLIDFHPAGGSWSASWNTLSTWDGRHVVVVRALDSQGRVAEFRRPVWVENVRNGTRLFPDRDNITFVVLGDNRPSGGVKQPEIYRQLLDHVLREGADFYASVGDIVYSGERREYEDFIRVTSVIRMPLFIAEGNHENQIGRRAQRNFMSLFGKLFFSFDYGNSHFIFLNANVPGYRYSMSDEQIEWFARDLQDSRARHIFVFIHQPIYPYAHGIEDRSALEKLRAVIRTYGGGIDAIFQGHEHMYYSAVNGSLRTFITGGGGAELDNQYPAKYLFFHYLVVRVNGDRVEYGLVRPPVLEVNDLPEFVDSPSLEVRGRAQPFATVEVNGHRIRPSKTGTFSATVGLEPGDNEISIRGIYNGTVLERRFHVTYLPHVEISVPDKLVGGSDAILRASCLGKPVDGLLVFNGTAHEMRNGKVKLRLPDVGGEAQASVAVYSKGCFPTATSVTVRSEPPFALIGGIAALAILVAGLLILRVRRGGVGKRGEIERLG